MPTLLEPLPPSFAATRDALHRLAVHVLARRRKALTGRIGLRAAAGGFATPAMGPDAEVLRTSGAWLVHERAGAEAGTRTLDLATATLAEAAAFAGVDLTQDHDVGADTPPVGEVAGPLAIDDAAARTLGGWYSLGWTVLDLAVAGAGAGAEPSVVQLWPEHFDAGCDLAARDGVRTNVGASPGDGFHPDPYLYVGPWGAERPGDRAYWTAPFGAVLGYAQLGGAPDPLATGLAFIQQGLRQLADG
ncbi:MAG: hypothetical protein Q8K58_05090 [Acidimicrobiales bacterium]|nr:hypothetical protein [Acidimicrobiales bacterium]